MITTDRLPKGFTMRVPTLDDAEAAYEVVHACDMADDGIPDHTLLLHAFGELYRRGSYTIGLGVDSQNLTGATRLYEQEKGKPEGFPVLGSYMARWMRWAHSGHGSVEHPGGYGMTVTTVLRVAA